jgi:hypothetical protein
VSSYSPYRFEHDSVHHFPAPPDQVWDELSRLDLYPEWSGWLTRYDVHGDGLRVGTVLDLTLDPSGPLAADLRLTLVKVEPQHAVDARVEGDLAGRGWLRLEEQQLLTRATISWEITAVGSRHRTAAVVARPFSRWIQWALARRTATRFRAHLEGASDAP